MLHNGAVTFLTIPHLTAGRDALLVLAGLGAGVFNGVAGGGTLITFPVLLAMGYPALTANVTSTVGIWPGYLGGVAGFRREIAGQSQIFRSLAPVTVPPESMIVRVTNKSCLSNLPASPPVGTCPGSRGPRARSGCCYRCARGVAVRTVDCSGTAGRAGPGRGGDGHARV